MFCNGWHALSYWKAAVVEGIFLSVTGLVSFEIFLLARHFTNWTGHNSFTDDTLKKAKMTQDVLKRCLQFHLSMNKCRRRLWQTDSKEAVWKVQSETDCRIFKTYLKPLIIIDLNWKFYPKCWTAINSFNYLLEPTRILFPTNMVRNAIVGKLRMRK